MDIPLINKTNEELLALLQEANQQTEEEKQKAKSLQDQRDSLQQQVEELRRLLFGAKRERFIAQDPDQLTLPFAVDGQQACEVVEEQVTISRKKAAKVPHPGRHAFPAHLPVEEVILEPEQDTSDMTCIGQEVTEELDIIPMRLLVRRFIRPKYVDKADGDGIVIAPAPNRALPSAKQHRDCWHRS